MEARKALMELESILHQAGGLNDVDLFDYLRDARTYLAGGNFGDARSGLASAYALALGQDDDLAYRINELIERMAK
ncbi:hypothetical protein C4580_01720 [Candidatus Woesearchaeota archaeon]|nr:MAG: hypothetical protein C4580_01720 [Candidatus Woesearchaeota archaeon]